MSTRQEDAATYNRGYRAASIGLARNAERAAQLAGIAPDHEDYELYIAMWEGGYDSYSPKGPRTMTENEDGTLGWIEANDPDKKYKRLSGMLRGLQRMAANEEIPIDYRIQAGLLAADVKDLLS